MFFIWKEKFKTDITNQKCIDVQIFKKRALFDEFDRNRHFQVYRKKQ